MMVRVADTIVPVINFVLYGVTVTAQVYVPVSSKSKGLNLTAI